MVLRILRISRLNSHLTPLRSNSSPKPFTTTSHRHPYPQRATRAMISSIGSFLNPNNLDLTSGANDVIVIRHRDGSLHSTPFNVRFGRMKVLRRGDKTVEVEVNDAKTTAVMKLGDDGGAYWLEPTVDAGYRPESPVDDECQVPLAAQDVKGKPSGHPSSQGSNAAAPHVTDVPASLSGGGTASGSAAAAAMGGGGAILPSSKSDHVLSDSTAAAAAVTQSGSTNNSSSSNAATGGHAADDSSKPLLMEDEHGGVTVATYNADPAEVHLAEETVRAANEAMAKLAQRKPHQFLIDAARRDQEDYAQPPMSPQEVEHMQQNQPQDTHGTEFGPESSDFVSDSFLAQRRKSTYDDFLHLFESKAFDENKGGPESYQDGGGSALSGGAPSSSQPTESEGMSGSVEGKLDIPPPAASIEIAVHKDANGSLSDARSSFSGSSQSAAYHSDEGSDYGHDEVDEYLFQAPVEYEEEEPLETRSLSDSQAAGDGEVNNDSIAYHNDTSPALHPHNDSFNTGSFAGMLSNSVNSFNAEVSMYFKRTLIPISADLEKLQLQEGRNSVRYITQTSLRGRVVVEASIYLWDYQDRIVVSDIDGTVTKSDVWGHLLPLFGRDWTHPGICSLYSKISANNYKFVYLTARSVSQVQMTRNFLWNIQQDGVRLPYGPVLTAPQRFFTALTQEVSKRAHLFKIACLESVIDAFPPQTKPFYAGFGNRMNDLVAYTATKIPKHKIFIIDTNSVLHVSYVKQTYKNLAHLVDVTFPPVVRRRALRTSLAPTNRSVATAMAGTSMSEGLRNELSGGSDILSPDDLPLTGTGSGEGYGDNAFNMNSIAPGGQEARGGGGGSALAKGRSSGVVVDVLDLNPNASPLGGAGAGGVSAASGSAAAAGAAMGSTNGSAVGASPLMPADGEGQARKQVPLATTHYDSHDDDITVEQEFNWCNYWRVDPKQLVSPAPKSAGTISAAVATAASSSSPVGTGATKPVTSPLDALHSATTTKTAPPPRVTTPVLPAPVISSMASTPTASNAGEGSLRKEGSRSIGSSADTKAFMDGDTRSGSTEQQPQPQPQPLRNNSFSDLFRRSPFLAPRSSSTFANASPTGGSNPPLLPTAVASSPTGAPTNTTPTRTTTAVVGTSSAANNNNNNTNNSQRRFNFSFGLSWKKDSNVSNTSAANTAKGYTHPSYVELRHEIGEEEEQQKGGAQMDTEGSKGVPHSKNGGGAAAASGSGSGGLSKWQFWKTTKPTQQQQQQQQLQQSSVDETAPKFEPSVDEYSPLRKMMVEDDRNEEAQPQEKGMVEEAERGSGVGSGTSSIHEGKGNEKEKGVENVVHIADEGGNSETGKDDSKSCAVEVGVKDSVE